RSLCTHVFCYLVAVVVRVSAQIFVLYKRARSHAVYLVVGRSRHCRPGYLYSVANVLCGNVADKAEALRGFYLISFTDSVALVSRDSVARGIVVGAVHFSDKLCPESVSRCIFAQPSNLHPVGLVFVYGA